MTWTVSFRPASAITLFLLLVCFVIGVFSILYDQSLFVGWIIGIGTSILAVKSARYDEESAEWRRSH